MTGNTNWQHIQKSDLFHFEYPESTKFHVLAQRVSLKYFCTNFIRVFAVALLFLCCFFVFVLQKFWNRCSVNMFTGHSPLHSHHSLSSIYWMKFYARLQIHLLAADTVIWQKNWIVRLAFPLTLVINGNKFSHVWILGSLFSHVYIHTCYNFFPVYCTKLL